MRNKRPYRAILAICFAIGMGIYLWATLVGLHNDEQQDQSRINAAMQGSDRDRDALNPFRFDQSISDVPTSQPTAPVLTALAPQSIPQVSLTDLSRQFPEFQHIPFNSSGFNPLQLPFRYEDVDNVGDQSEANAFSFLLSSALDWAPGNYCERHAYFVFKRSRDKIRPLIQSYDSAVIADLVQSWKATHGVGGVLIRSKNGCSGRLEIYERNGQLAFSKDYEKPRGYFDLLGDMAVDAITFFGPPPNKDLVQYLHAPRCQNAASIVRLGTAAFLPERGEEEFGLYSTILQNDPDFAEVRDWWAGQKYWQVMDEAELERQMGLALQSRVTISTLANFNPQKCRDQQLSDQLPNWIATGEKLAGAQTPIILYKKIASADSSVGYDPQLMRQAIEVAGLYPNWRPLLDQICTTQLWQTRQPVDAELLASISIAALSDRYMDAVGDKIVPYDCLATALLAMGRNDLAASVLAHMGTPPTTVFLLLRCKALSNMGRFDDVVTLFQSQPNIDRDNIGIEVAMETAVAAAASGNATALQQICHDWETEFDDHGFTAVLAAYNAAAAGKPVDMQQLLEKVGRQSGTVGARPVLLLAAQVDLMEHRRDFETMVWQFMLRNPNDRLYWVLFDAYQRRTPSVFAPAFYQSLAWLNPDDPRVAEAVGDWRTRKMVPLSDDQRRELDSLKDLYFGTPPWTVAQAVHQLLDLGNVADAHDMALRYQAMAPQANKREVSAWAAKLVRLTATGKQS